MAEPKWLEIARKEIGVKEIAGSASNPRVEEYHKIGSNQPTWKDDVPWCASFVGWVLETAGLPSTNSGMARSYLDYGTPLEEPRVGCIVVYKRGAPPAGHVHFFLSKKDGRVYGIGGNQSDQVNLDDYAEADVIGYRWPDVPPDVPKPEPKPLEEKSIWELIIELFKRIFKL